MPPLWLQLWSVLLSIWSFAVSAMLPVEISKYPCAFIDTVNVTETFRRDILERNGNGAAINDMLYINMLNTRGSNLSGNVTVNDIKVLNNNNNSNNRNNTSIHDLTKEQRELELVGFYDFIVENGVRIPAARHLRACICKLKPCVRFCCAQGYYYDVVGHTCTDVKPQERNTNTNSSSIDQRALFVRNGNDSATYQVNTNEHFNVHIGTPCTQMRPVFKEQAELIPWTLYENGSIAYKHHTFSRHYCYSPYQLSNKTWTWQPLLCTTEKLPFILGAREWAFTICLILAAICMFIILFIYYFCTEIRNTFYGVAIKAYCLCIISGYSLLVHLTVTDPAEMQRLTCVFIAGFVLLFLLLSYYILTFVSFNFYLNFHDVVLTKLMFWLIFFPMTSLAICWSLFVSLAHYDRKPVFGGDTCWFDPRNLSIMIYFYTPIYVACAVSIFFYILTRIRITEQQQGSTHKNAKPSVEENRYTTFWRFFGYTLIMLMVTVISVIVNYHTDDQTLVSNAISFVVALHGICSLYTLVVQNQQIQSYLRGLENDIEDDDDEIRQSALPMTPLERD